MNTIGPFTFSETMNAPCGMPEWSRPSRIWRRGFSNVMRLFFVVFESPKELLTMDVSVDGT